MDDIPPLPPFFVVYMELSRVLCKEAVFHFTTDSWLHFERDSKHYANPKRKKKTITLPMLFSVATQFFPVPFNYQYQGTNKRI